MVSTVAYIPGPAACGAHMPQYSQKDQSSSAIGTIHFLQSWTPRASIRQQELTRSAQRAHAARQAHLRRREAHQGRQRTGLVLSISSLCKTMLMQAVRKCLSTARIPQDDVTNRQVAGKSLSTELEPCRETAIVRPYLPMTCLAKGNSDPFDCHVFGITPSVNRMFTFARDVYFQTLAVAPLLRRILQGEADHARYFSFGQGNADTTAAQVVCYSACLSRFLPNARDFETEWLPLRIQALRRLRALLSQRTEHSEPAPVLVRQICYLLQADVEARQLDTATSHAMVLKQLFQFMLPNRVTIPLYFGAIHIGLLLATLRFEPTIINLEDWHPTMWQMSWSQVESVVEGLEGPSGLFPTEKELHPIIESHFLRGYFCRFRHYQSIVRLDVVDTLDARSKGVLLAQWAHTRLTDDAAKLLNRYIVLTTAPASSHCEGRLVDTDSLRKLSVSTLIDATLTLSILCTLWVHFLVARIPETGIDIRDISDVLAPKLRETLMALSAHSTSPQLADTGYQEMLFWMLFAGAIFEQSPTIYRRQRLEMEKETSKAQTNTKHHVWWFSSQLAGQARRLGLTRWQNAKNLLERFAYDDLLDPNFKDRFGP